MAVADVLAQESVWWGDPAKVAQLLRYLRDTGDVYTVDDAIGVTEKPYNWTREYLHMCREEGE